MIDDRPEEGLTGVDFAAEVAKMEKEQQEKEFDEAKSFVKKKDWDKAVPLLTKHADLGRAEAQYELGRCYEKGNGVTKSEDQALLWYGKAANQGNGDAKKAQSAIQDARQKALDKKTRDEQLAREAEEKRLKAIKDAAAAATHSVAAPKPAPAPKPRARPKPASSGGPIDVKKVEFKQSLIYGGITLVVLGLSFMDLPPFSWLVKLLGILGLAAKIKGVVGLVVLIGVPALTFFILNKVMSNWLTIVHNRYFMPGHIMGALAMAFIVLNLVSWGGKTAKQQVTSIVQQARPTAVVTVDALNVRAGPGTNNALVGTLRRGAEVEIMDDSGLWWRIKAPNFEGYVNSTYVQKSGGK